MFEDFTYEQRIAFVEAMANIIASDRKVAPEEKAELDGLVASAGLSIADPAVAAAIDRQLSGNGGSLTGILHGLQAKELRSAVFRMLIETACADGAIAPEERAKVLEAAALFGYDKGAAGDLVDWTLQSILHEKREQEILTRLG